jgi:hypothetical protein
VGKGARCVISSAAAAALPSRARNREVYACDPSGQPQCSAVHRLGVHRGATIGPALRRIDRNNHSTVKTNTVVKPCDKTNGYHLAV